jgi:hypothetical protein
MHHRYRLHLSAPYAFELQCGRFFHIWLIDMMRQSYLWSAAYNGTFFVLPCTRSLAMRLIG